MVEHCEYYEEFLEQLSHYQLLNTAIASHICPGTFREIRVLYYRKCISKREAKSDTVSCSVLSVGIAGLETLVFCCLKDYLGMCLLVSQTVYLTDEPCFVCHEQPKTKRPSVKWATLGRTNML
jgi:hypothetical protein